MRVVELVSVTFAREDLKMLVNVLISYYEKKHLKI